MALNTPTNYNGSTGNQSRVISPASTVSSPESNYVTSRIYRGFASNNPNARNGVLYDADIIKQDIYNHFMTARGERVMMPEFGSVIWDYLYEPLDEQTKEIMLEDAKEIVGQDPRVELLEADISGFESGVIINLKLNILPQNMVQQMMIEFNINQTGSSMSGNASGGSSSGGMASGGGY
jgi:phage baseplate assembly protein W|tara:strand:- start:554 stop:1090 length:537 start_codon:yes stop_codon:yes gene_type:complete